MPRVHTNSNVVSSIEKLTEDLSPLISEIVDHPLYSNITSLAAMRCFMEQHVFAVWDFMCLVKELYRGIVSTSAPWFPPKDALSANLLYSILSEEEGDLTEEGNYASHFDIYLTAMEKINANTTPIKKLLRTLRKGQKLEKAIHSIPLRPGTKNFVLTTFSFFKRPLHEVAAAFVYGREGITSAMFIPIVKQLEAKMNSHEKERLSTLIYYLNRHITLDNGEHFPKALTMLSNLIGNNQEKLKQTKNAAIRALKARVIFLTDIQKSLPLDT